MDIFIFSDESGVFDKNHESYYVYGGVLFLSKKDKDDQARKYIAAEKNIRMRKTAPDGELKASKLSNQDKLSLLKSLKLGYKFGIVIDIANTFDAIHSHKKTKQRYLDFAYKLGLKRLLEELIRKGEVCPDDNLNIFIYVDEHTTATDGRYELQEGLEEEFKRGTINFENNKYFPPIFKNLTKLKVNFVDSNTMPLIRASDLVANHIYFASKNSSQLKFKGIYRTLLPSNKSGYFKVNNNKVKK